jgi:hypothetical protein
VLNVPDTCADPYCADVRPPGGAETAFGWYAVGEDFYCPLHGYGAYLEAKRRARFERWKAENKPELDRREAARKAEIQAARQAQSANSRAVDALIERYSRSNPASPTE